jgi:mono/diheme cytochrome c family protein
MTSSTLARPAVALLAVVAFVACSKSQTGGAPSTSASPAASAAPARPAAAAMPFTPMMVAEGDSLFHARNCKNCHGPDAKGAKNGPNLTSGPFLHMTGQYNEIVQIVTNGIPLDSIKDKSHVQPMRPRGGNPPLTDAQVKSIAAYVYTLSHK